METDKQHQIEDIIRSKFEHPSLFIESEFPKDSESWVNLGKPHQWSLFFENSDIILYNDSGYGYYFLITTDLLKYDYFRHGFGGNKEIGYIVSTEIRNGELTIAKVIN